MYDFLVFSYSVKRKCWLDLTTCCKWFLVYQEFLFQSTIKIFVLFQSSNVNVQSFHTNHASHDSSVCRIFPHVCIYDFQCLAVYLNYRWKRNGIFHLWLDNAKITLWKPLQLKVNLFPLFQRDHFYQKIKKLLPGAIL